MLGVAHVLTYFRGVATRGYIGIYTHPQISPSKLLWGKNDVRTAIQQFYTPQKKILYPPKKKQISVYAPDLLTYVLDEQSR